MDPAPKPPAPKPPEPKGQPLVDAAEYPCAGRALRVYLAQGFTPRSVPLVFGLRGELIVRVARETPLCAVAVGFQLARRAGTVTVRYGRECKITVTAYPNVPMDLCMLLRRALLAKGDAWINPIGESPDAITPLSLIPYWEVRLYVGDEAQGQGLPMAWLLGTLGRDACPRVPFYLSRRPAPMRMLPGIPAAFSINLPASGRGSPAPIRYTAWEYGAWASLFERGAVPIPWISKDKSLRIVPPLAVRVRVELGTDELGRVHFDGVHQSAITRTIDQDRLPGLLTISPASIGTSGKPDPGLTLQRYHPESPAERTLTLYWINALGGWETSIVEWAEWIAHGCDEPWHEPLQLWRGGDPTASMGRASASTLRGRIYAPGQAERRWLGELIDTPLALLTPDGRRHAPAQIAHAEQHLEGAADSVWVEVELRVAWGFETLASG